MIVRRPLSLAAGAILALGLAGPGVAAEPAAALVITDPCGGSPRCQNPGTFIVEVLEVAPTNPTGQRNHTVTLTMRFRNISDKPIILAYRTGSGAGLDNLGNAYYHGHGNSDASTKGIGVVDGRSADPQFSLSPGQSRSATFAVTRFNARPPYGTSFSYNLVVAELEILPGQAIRTVRENNISFSNLAPGGTAGVASAAGAAPGTSTDAATEALGVANQVLGLFNKKK